MIQYRELEIWIYLLSELDSMIPPIRAGVSSLNLLDLFWIFFRLRQIRSKSTANLHIISSQEMDHEVDFD